MRTLVVFAALALPFASSAALGDPSCTRRTGGVAIGGLVLKSGCPVMPRGRGGLRHRGYPTRYNFTVYPRS